MPGLTLLGLGPGHPDQLTREAWRVLEQASEVYVRTEQHPTVQAFPKHIRVHSFDALYEQAETFEEVYANIVNQVWTLAQRPQGVIYAVPGHPLVAESTGVALLQRARAHGLPVRIVEGLSFLDAVWRALGVDPFPRTALLDALDVARRLTPPHPPSTPALIAQLYSRDVASGVKLTLMHHFPDEHPVVLVHRAGLPDEVVREFALYEIDRDPEIGLLTTLYVTPLPEGTSFEEFENLIARLRAPDGCPWDRKQTHQSLRKHLLEEAYEVLDALDRNDPTALREELGDLLLQIVLHTQIAVEEGEFTMPEVLKTVYDKIIRRHPHVFGDVKVKDADEVLRNWEAIKRREKATKQARAPQEQPSVLDDLPRALPALAQAQAIQRKVGEVGFDWPDIQGVWKKVEEELDEVRTATSPDATTREIGDLLFAVVNLARHLDVDAESALREANQRFARRFREVERQALAQGRELERMSLEEMDALWERAKRTEPPTSNSTTRGEDARGDEG
ncbi:MAG: nucleoside triphosphate pyrophosphohydrolase [Chloroflexi bacterium]|nr:nucleoside triphosphate pyrophosphohydrolase [Chloroflexota bacterium]